VASNGNVHTHPLKSPTNKNYRRRQEEIYDYGTAFSHPAHKLRDLLFVLKSNLVSMGRLILPTYLQLFLMDSAATKKGTYTVFCDIGQKLFPMCLLP
jgi:hypothetical protein